MKQYNVTDVLNNMRFKTQYNSIPSKGEVNNGKDMTVPDQSMTISEILRRFGSGLPLGGSRVEFWEGDEDMWNGVDPRTLDISEREAIIKDRVAELAFIQKQQKDLTKKQKQDQQRQLEDKIREQMKKQTGEDQNDIKP